VAASPDVTQRVLAWAHLDFSPGHRPPQWWRVALATVLAVALSLAADAALVAIGTRLFPATRGYVHFEFSDYAKLTVIGVVVACAAWPIVTRISSSPRWLFFRLAIAVTLVLYLPDLYIWHQGQPGHAVAVLMTMHLAIALITYNLLVHLAPVRTGRTDDAGAPGAPGGAPARRSSSASGRDGVDLG
jgi:Family of unknown function (DUF6069)